MCMVYLDSTEMLSNAWETERFIIITGWNDKKEGKNSLHNLIFTITVRQPYILPLSPNTEVTWCRWADWSNTGLQYVKLLIIEYAEITCWMLQQAIQYTYVR